ncbi:MAG: hypothetical protein CVU00_00205 [Bacteroidetes bacterium HGW-Bacteroidetes-17]|nr:MAG: hypothetical protein CVU00_00205 [Bacteroidetes bacterium HGW-Bacteroidetes-17]
MQVKYIIASMLLTVSLSLTVNAQEKKQTQPGGYHGELDFVMSWKHYYSYNDWTKIMHDMQKKYPNLASIESIGKSRMGKDQYLLTITAKKTGMDTEKPAMWVDGAIHGNEVNGIMCSLYTAWYLLTRYDYDPYVFEMLNKTTFYILPGLNVDANESYVKFPNTENNPREPYRPEDNDGDGLYDEDQTEDVDGDGELTTMYKEDPNGMFKLSIDGRRFEMITDKAEKVMRFNRIGSEGFDNDGDGSINEDDLGGPDPNRNFPSDWNLQAGNPYPMSESETRNVFEFQLAHPNIFASFHFHNTGRLIMFSRPPQARDNRTPEQVAQAKTRFDQQLAERRKENKYAQAFDYQVQKGYETDMETQTKIVEMGARILKNYRPTPSGGQGQAQASSYEMLGNYAYLIELWGSPVFAADKNDDGRITEEEYVEFVDIELNGEGWINPYQFNHPDLGEIWMGGSLKKHIGRTPPARYIEMEAEKNAQFVMYCASQFPKVEIESIEVTPAVHNLLWVDVIVKNDKVYPTVSDRTIKLGDYVKDKIFFNSSGNIELLEITDESTTIPTNTSSAKAKSSGTKETEFLLGGEDSLRIRYLVKTNGADGWIEFNTESVNGGKDKKRIEIDSM